MKRSLVIAGALLCVLSGRAHAACDANNTYAFNFNSQPTASLNYANSYNYTASNPLGATRAFTASFATNGLSSTQAGGAQMPRIDNAIISSGTGGKTLTVGGVFSSRTATITSNTRTIRVTFTFAVPIRDLAVTVHDIDFTNNQYRDWLHVSGSDGAATYAPAMTSPHGSNNSGSPTAAGSSLRFGPYASSAPPLSSSEAMGTGSSGNTNTNTGDINVSFPQPVTSVTLRYGNFPLGGGEFSTGQQAYGISTIRFCPMPNVAIAKSSAPFATTGPDRFNAPGSDVSYSLTVTNSGGSPVDLGSLALTDALPSNVTFYNGDYDPALPGMGPVQLVAGSSGVTLPAGSLSYSQDGTTWTSSAASGYAPLVRHIRLIPGGSLAANASVTFRFRARVN